MLFKDIRDYQILFLSLFLILGIGTRDWTLHPELIGVAIASCIITQIIFSLLTKSPEVINLRSPLITSLGLSLLLRADHWTTMALAGFAAIASKFIFQSGEKHFFNPANFGIIAVLTLTNDAWVTPGQWGEEWWYALLFAGTGGMILQRVGRWDTTAAFLGAYSLLAAIRNMWLGWTWDVYFHHLMSGSFLLFALFMVTDPRSIPNAPMSRIIWAISIAFLTFILRNYFFIPTAVFWALFALAPLTIFLDKFWVKPRFYWNNQAETHQLTIIN
ncbi:MULTISPECIES: RnfABCDGE type electron transport complex subunit D [unclassified Anabaena]|uniref:RnfABCDGE type electron transport complex subunit D n=1 Tax=unclassified Anabaena TaxID=2619674 RepID=UPI001446DE98|nr:MULTISPECIES: RnfABCDGE type electron transport complex subunit D [unclassified Anabaena]MTJ06673.1 Na+-transporting NADH:ubiquinone oxidoreductase, subunit NqrB [Anabaena sp. UHCC 0204]MTJ54439.1 Na+-transporting NADH:ubiquinone oxidoreductase, subunit NqrB [Anabaena sp. UHCC 0253]